MNKSKYDLKAIRHKCFCTLNSRYAPLIVSDEADGIAGLHESYYDAIALALFEPTTFKGKILGDLLSRLPLEFRWTWGGDAITDYRIDIIGEWEPLSDDELEVRTPQGARRLRLSDPDCFEQLAAILACYGVALDLEGLA